MAGRCVHHPGRPEAIKVGGKSYCSQCQTGQQNAAARVDRHVVPKPCFVWYRGANTWTAITGTGCAHWVAHAKSITHGTPTTRCLEGFTLRVPDLIRGKTQVAQADVRVGDIYANRGRDHCGMVSRVTARTGQPTQIEIEHDSSRQGGVSRNDFATYFHGQGDFFR